MISDEQTFASSSAKHSGGDAAPCATAVDRHSRRSLSLTAVALSPDDAHGANGSTTRVAASPFGKRESATIGTAH